MGLHFVAGYVVLVVLLILGRLYLFPGRKKIPKSRNKLSSSPPVIITASEWAHAFLTERGYTVSWDIASLKEVDRFLDENIDDDTHRPCVGGFLAEDTEMILVSIGVYLGEVMLREYGGRWGLGADEYVLPQLLVDVPLNLKNTPRRLPVHQVLERLTRGKAYRLYDYAVNGTKTRQKGTSGNNAIVR
jgi:hypothetical protein